MKTLHYILLVLVVCFSNAGMAAAPEGRFVDLPDAHLWIVDSGGTGDAVILLHPRTGNSEVWQYTIPALADAGYRAIAIDYPGWGKSIVREGQEPVPVAETLDALIERLGLGNVHVVGTAMGGYIALDYAAWQQDGVSSLVIAASGLGLENDPEYDAYRMRAEIPGMADQPSHIREISPNYRAGNPDGVARWRAIYEKAQQDGTPRPPLRTPNTPAKLASIRVPTLLIAGGMDLVTPSGAIRLYSRHLTAPHEFAVVPEAGHVLVWEQPEVFNRILIEFLQKH